MTFYDHLLDFAAKVNVATFRVSGSYFYEDRTTGERFTFQDVDKPAETAIDFLTSDPVENTTASSKGRAFLIERPVKEKIDAWRSGLGRDLTHYPTPAKGDYIVKIWGGVEYKYQIDHREPYSTIGSSEEVYQINTVLVLKNDDAIN